MQLGTKHWAANALEINDQAKEDIDNHSYRAWGGDELPRGPEDDVCRDGWGPSPARQVSLAPLTMKVSEVAQGAKK